MRLLDALASLADTVWHALLPAMLGAAVGQAWKPGLSWRQRVLQWCVGITVSYYATRAADAVFELHDFVAQAIGFILAMIAFEATPKFGAAMADLVTSLPARFAAWLDRKVS